MMGILLLTCFMGCSKCFHGVICDVTLRERECDNYNTCKKSATLTTLVTMKMWNYQSEEFLGVIDFPQSVKSEN
jgi:hypothetical protein